MLDTASPNIPVRRDNLYGPGRNPHGVKIPGCAADEMLGRLRGRCGGRGVREEVVGKCGSPIRCRRNGSIGSSRTSRDSWSATVYAISNMRCVGRLHLNVVKIEAAPSMTAQMGARPDDSLKLVEETIESIRDEMAELRPAVLDDYGLTAVRHFPRRAGGARQRRPNMRAARRSP